MLSVRLLSSSRLLVVKILGSQKLHVDWGASQCPEPLCSSRVNFVTVCVDMERSLRDVVKQEKPHKTNRL